MGVSHDVSGTLRAQEHGHQPAVMAFDTTQITSKQNGSIPDFGKSCHTLNANAHVPCVALDMNHADVSSTLKAQEHGHQPAVIAFAQNQREEVRNVGDKAVSLAAEVGMHCQTFVALDMSHACDVIRDCGEVSPRLQARMGTGGNQVPLTYQMQGFGDYRAGEVASSCKQRDFKDGTDLVGAVVGTAMIVRRLTPMECERLQGYPDGWTDIGEWMDSKGKRHKDADSPRYKALGNSIALPFWDFLAKRISAQYLRPVTMGSLFDGIGGFPLVFERHNGKGTARWASEIEEFPIAVTKLRFGED